MPNADAKCPRPSGGLYLYFPMSMMPMPMRDADCHAPESKRLQALINAGVIDKSRTGRGRGRERRKQEL